MKKLKKIMAITGVVVIAILYLATIISACIVTPATKGLFLGSLVATVIVPVIMYIFQMLCRVFMKEDSGETQRLSNERAFQEAKKNREKS